MCCPGVEIVIDLTLWLYVWIGLAVVLLPVQLVITAPYGRHSVSGWGPMINNTSAWIAMELVALVGFWGASLHARQPLSPVAWVAACLWSVHYVNRALIYPLRTRTRGKRMPVVVMIFAMLFNTVNSLVNGTYTGADLLQGGDAGLLGSRSLFGLLLFVTGWIINLQADNTLLGLRQADEQGYSLPSGGLFERISCPNFFGEIVEWCGFAVFCWNLPALAFAIWTAANLVPRALAHHRWYLQEFPHYPTTRKAIFPYLL